MVIKRENTIILDFKNVRKKPSNLVLHKWIKETFNFNVDQVMCIQFDHIRYKVYVKLISDLIVKKALETYENGIAIYKDEEENEHEIYLSEDCEEILVKIFDFPFELSNQRLKEVLSKYGLVKGIKNEKWNGEGLYNVESGVRLVHIVMKNKIPSYITVDGMTSLVTYRNQIRTCMLCEDTGYERRDCPKKASNRLSQLRRPNAPLPSRMEIVNENPTYASATSNTAGANQPMEVTKTTRREIGDNVEIHDNVQKENMSEEETIIEETQETERQDNLMSTQKQEKEKSRKQRGK